MTSLFWLYISAALLSVVAGVAIAGVPSTTPQEPTIEPPTTTIETPIGSTGSSAP